MTSQSQLLKELDSKTCRCGRDKTRQQTFCKPCYWSLPAEMRTALYRRLGHGYEEAYEAAVGYLDAVEQRKRNQDCAS